MSDNAFTDNSIGTELPQKPVDDTALRELRNKVKYSKSKEFQELKAVADQRIDFYTKFLPNGKPIVDTTPAEREKMWQVANIVIAEFQQLFGEFEFVEEILKEEFGE